MTSGSPSGPSKEQEQLDSKRKITELVRIKFARFGDEALAIVLAYALQPVRMPLLLERLELRISSPDLATRLDAVCQWIFDNGPIQFKMRAMAERREALKPADATTLPDFRPGVVPPADTGHGGPVAQPHDTQSRPQPAPHDTNSRQQSAPHDSQSRPRPAPHDTQSKVQAQAAPAAPVAPAGPMINVPGYSGPERRSGTERRYKPDRRARLDATDRNKRFGGDRRKSPKGRRKEDQPKPDFWWRFIPFPPEK